MAFEQGMLWATEVIALDLQYESVASASSVCPFSSFPLERVVPALLAATHLALLWSLLLSTYSTFLLSRLEEAAAAVTWPYRYLIVTKAQ